MLNFITKAELFSWAEALKIPNRGNVKDFQDAYILSMLNDKSRLRILEMGGGDSRVLRDLSANNECWNLDIFEGKDGGPAEEIVIPRVRNVHGLMGQFSEKLPEDYFDWVLSISVIEHIRLDQLSAVFSDCARVLKPGGYMAHAIDVYLLSEAHANHEHCKAVKSRINGYLTLVDPSLELVGPAIANGVHFFDTSYVTNSDQAMISWNKTAPTLKPLREIAQGTSLKGLWRKRA